MHPDITALAATQHGLVTRRQLVARQLSPDRIDTAVRRDRLHREAYGVYAVPGAPPTRARELMLAALRCGPDALVVGEPVLAMLRLHGARPEAAPIVLARPGRRLTNIPWTWRPRPEDWPGQRAEVHGLPSVNVTWNLLEAAAQPDLVPDAVLERLSDGVRWSGKAAVRAVRSAMTAHAGTHPGAARLLASGLFDVGAPESSPERIVVERLAHHGAVTQVEVLEGVRVDVLLPAVRIVLEYLGFPNHSSRRDRERDDDRVTRLRAAGFVVVLVREADLKDLDAFVARIDLLVETLTAEF